MKSFTDTAGREWTLHATYTAYARIRAATGVDLGDIATTQKCVEQMQDRYTLGGVIWAWIEPQATERGLTEEQWGEAIDGTVLDTVVELVIEEAIFFCPPHKRKFLGLALDRVRAAEKTARSRLEGSMEALASEMDRALAMSMSASLGLSSPASSASTQASGASASSVGPSPDAAANNGITPPASSASSAKYTATRKNGRGRSRRLSSTR